MGVKWQSSALIKIGLAYGVWQMVDQWSRLILPFLQWEYKPQPDSFKIGLANTIGNLCTLVGTFLCGHLLDSSGTKFASLCATVLIGGYCIGVSQIDSYAVFLAIQVLRVGNAFPQITESFVGTVFGSKDEKNRMRALIWLGVPNGIALVLGPWLAVRILIVFDYDLRMAHAVAGFALVALMLPLVLFVLPEPRANTQLVYARRLPSLYAYGELLGNVRLRRVLLFKLFVDAPFIAYDQVGRLNFVTFMVNSPADMSHIAIMIGVATLLTNTVLMRPLQRHLTAQRMLQLSLLILTVTYGLLASATGYWQLIVLMPIQVLAVTVAYATLGAQLLGTVDVEDMGKAVGLSQCVQQAAATVVPLLAGYFYMAYEYSTMCYASAAVTLLALPLVHVAGKFLQKPSEDLLPGFSSATEPPQFVPSTGYGYHYD